VKHILSVWQTVLFYIDQLITKPAHLSFNNLVDEY